MTRARYQVARDGAGWYVRDSVLGTPLPDRHATPEDAAGRADRLNFAEAHAACSALLSAALGVFPERPKEAKP